MAEHTRVEGYAGPLRLVMGPLGYAIVHAIDAEHRVLCRVNERGKADGGERGVYVAEQPHNVTCRRCRRLLDARAREG